jgi:hypothetical protein
MEHRHGLLVVTEVTQATGTAEREAAPAVVEAIPRRHRITRGAAKNDETRDVVHERRERRGRPHVAPHERIDQSHRRPDDLLCGLCRESAATEMRRRDF